MSFMSNIPMNFADMQTLNKDDQIKMFPKKVKLVKSIVSSEFSRKH